MSKLQTNMFETLNHVPTGRALLVDSIKAESIAGGVAGKLLKLAQVFTNVEAFESHMALEYKWIRSDEGLSYLNTHSIVPEMDDKGNVKIPAHFMQTKSNLVVGWHRFGMNPAKYDTIAQWNADLQKFRKEQNVQSGKKTPAALKAAVKKELAGSQASLAQLKPEDAQVLEALAAVMASVDETSHGALVTRLKALITQYRKSIDGPVKGMRGLGKKPKQETPDVPAEAVEAEVVNG